MQIKLVQEVYRLVYWVSNRKLPADISPQDREDAVQDAFEAVLVVQAKADPKKNLRALANIRIRGALYDFMKKRTEDTANLSDINPEETENQQGRTPESRITKKDLAMQTRIMMYGLKNKERKAVEKYYFEGKNIREIAEDLDVSLSTAWRLVRQGVSELRESMTEYHPDGVNWKC